MIFDLIILLIILSGPIFIYIVWFSKYSKKKTIKQRKPLITTAAFLIIIMESIVIYGSFFEPRIIVVNEQDIYLNENADKKLIRLALVSDFHLGPYNKSSIINKTNEKIKQANPDIVLLAGDYITRNENDGLYFKDFKPTAENYPTYAIWGNHDYSLSRLTGFIFKDRRDVTKKVFNEIGVNVLENESVLIQNNENKFWLIGIGEIWANHDDFDKAAKNIYDDIPKIVLVHNPDFVNKLQNYDIKADLLLAGHTHGGQIRLPIIGPVPPLPTDLGKQFDKGLLDFKEQKLFITSGIGQIGTRARLFNFPEIVILNIYY